jgi:membrane protein DedA with SNARE-associated domain
MGQLFVIGIVMLNQVLDALRAVPAPVDYVLIAVLVFSEAALFVGFVLPGETAVFLGGVLAATGNISLTLVLLSVVAAAIIGDAVGYAVGRRFGPRILQLRILEPHQTRLESAQIRLRERGGWAVFLGRFTAFLRAVMPGLAGLSHMPLRRFLAFNAAGGLVWGIGVAMLGFGAGHSYEKVAGWLGRSSTVLLVLFVLFLLVLWHRHRKNDVDQPIA